MQLIRGLHHLKDRPLAGAVVTIGNYDGLHLGHHKIINFVKQKSQELNLPAVVIIFEPQPQEFFTGVKSERLTSLREKLILLKESRIDIVLILSFNAYLAAITAEQFIDKILIAAIGVRHLMVGDDFVFGHGRSGDFSLLQKFATNGKFQITQIPSYKVDGVRVSSSLIRSALAASDFTLATKLLGRNYSISGRVIKGNNLGHTIGFPTANLSLCLRELPFAGVYLVKICDLELKPLFGLANIGFRPTFNGKRKSFEVYIFDFNADIYHQRLTIQFITKVRDEKKFNSKEELQTQIAKDLTRAKTILKEFK
jgi:riboflavin kinase / FMN adenylyltransferase